LDLIKKLKRDFDTSIIFITHDMGVVADIADDILVMYSGEEVEYASTNDIFKNPKHPYTQGLLASIPRLDQEEDILFVIKGSVPDQYNMPLGCKFSPRCKYAVALCKEKVPPLIKISESYVRCWKYHTSYIGSLNE